MCFLCRFVFTSALIDEQLINLGIGAVLRDVSLNHSREALRLFSLCVDVLGGVPSSVSVLSHSPKHGRRYQITDSNLWVLSR